MQLPKALKRGRLKGDAPLFAFKTASFLRAPGSSVADPAKNKSGQVRFPPLPSPSWVALDGATADCRPNRAAEVRSRRVAFDISAHGIIVIVFLACRKPFSKAA